MNLEASKRRLYDITSGQKFIHLNGVSSGVYMFGSKSEDIQ